MFASEAAGKLQSCLQLLTHWSFPCSLRWEGSRARVRDAAGFFEQPRILAPCMTRELEVPSFGFLVLLGNNLETESEGSSATVLLEFLRENNWADKLKDPSSWQEEGEEERVFAS